MLVWIPPGTQCASSAEAPDGDHYGVATPIDIDGRHISAVHNDITVDALLDSLLSSRLEGASHVVFQADGTLVAHAGLMNEIAASAGKYRMQDSQDGALLGLWRAAQ